MTDSRLVAPATALAIADADWSVVEVCGGRRTGRTHLLAMLAAIMSYRGENVAYIAPTSIAKSYFGDCLYTAVKALGGPYVFSRDNPEPRMGWLSGRHGCVVIHSQCLGAMRGWAGGVVMLDNCSLDDDYGFWSDLRSALPTTRFVEVYDNGATELTARLFYPESGCSKVVAPTVGAGVSGDGTPVGWLPDEIENAVRDNAPEIADILRERIAEKAESERTVQCVAAVPSLNSISVAWGDSGILKPVVERTAVDVEFRCHLTRHPYSFGVSLDFEIRVLSPRPLRWHYGDTIVVVDGIPTFSAAAEKAKGIARDLLLDRFEVPYNFRSMCKLVELSGASDAPTTARPVMRTYAMECKD